VLVLAEAPGDRESESGHPLVGYSGQLLWDELRKRTGIERRDCRVENVVEVQPPHNEFASVQPGLFERMWQPSTYERVAACTDVKVVVALGNVALNTLRRAPLPLTKKGTWSCTKVAGKRQVKWRDKIGAWRGSVCTYKVDDARRVWMIPTYHPAYVLRNAGAYNCWVGDFDKVALAMVGELERYPQSRHIVAPTADDLYEWDRRVMAPGNDAVLTFDIETSPTGDLECIGFCLDPFESITIGLRSYHWALTGGVTRSDAWSYVRRWLASPVAKETHFGVFDCYVLRQRYGITIRNWQWDTHMLHHLLDPRDRHSLAYCASRDLRVQYWKDERKEGGE